MGYSDTDDYCNQAKSWQSVPSADEARKTLNAEHLDSSDKAVRDYRNGTKYSAEDDYGMATVKDNNIYIATTDDQHEKILDSNKKSI